MQQSKRFFIIGKCEFLNLIWPLSINVYAATKRKVKTVATIIKRAEIASASVKIAAEKTPFIFV